MLLLIGVVALSAIFQGICFDIPAIHQVTQPIDHAESPVWDPRTGLLYFVDAYNGKILSYNCFTKAVYSTQLKGIIGSIIPSKTKNTLIVGLNLSVIAIDWNGRGNATNQRLLTTVQNHHPTSRLNDGKADKSGRVWIGTMGQESSTGISLNAAALFKITKENIQNPPAIISPVNISNGLAWNSNNDKFYYIDTFTQEIAEFDFNYGNGEISNRRVAFNLVENCLNNYPDGMTIDRDNNLWIALVGGGSIIQVNPTTGQLLQKIAIPPQEVTSLTWGGPSLNILFVTTSRRSLTDAQKLSQPTAGSVFAITNLGTSGLPIFYADII